jgi:cell division protein FtsL
METSDIVLLIASLAAAVVMVLTCIISARETKRINARIKENKEKIRKNEKEMEKCRRNFVELWSEMSEETRRESVFYFVRMFDREPTDAEIVIGKIETDKNS